MQRGAATSTQKDLVDAQEKRDRGARIQEANRRTLCSGWGV